MTERAEPLLQVENLRIELPTRRGALTAIDGVSFAIAPGEVLGIVGESGAGKSLTGAAIIGLLEPPLRIVGGQIRLAGRRIDNLPFDQMRRIRGREIGAIFQDPLTSLNPLYTVGEQLVETVRTHLGLDAAAARGRALALLDEVGIAAAGQRIDHYPHQFSGGMRQRVVIALALAANPRIVVADEPTTALDVSIQAQIIALLKRLCRENGTAIMLVTHDMGVIAETADRVAVMYAGRIVESGPVAAIVAEPHHPYTVGLMRSIPRLDGPVKRRRDPLKQIDGAMPRLGEIPPGCAFNPRCASAFARCRRERPELLPASGTEAACWLYDPAGRPGPVIGASQTRRDLEWGAQAVVPDRCTAADPAPGRRSSALGGSANDRTSTTGEAGAAEPQPLLEVAGLKRYFDASPSLFQRTLARRPPAVVKALDGVSFTIARGETFALVGESGCGKSTAARCIVGLHRPSAGKIAFAGTDLGSLKTRRAAAPLRRRMQMIFQDPYASLDPRWRVRRIIAEPLITHGITTGGTELRDRVAELLRQVQLTAGDADKYPHEFSGGQRQRISIARALAARPEFLICDEPTSALDVSVQAQILNLMQRLQAEYGLTYLFISHNLAVVRQVSDRVGVMYLGRLVEVAPTELLFRRPRHPYTRLLLDTVPRLDAAEAGRGERAPVAGEVPNPIAPPPGCAFHPRCPSADARCRRERPEPIATGGAVVACHAVAEGRLPVMPGAG